jgi:hypothetical protein
MISVVLGADDTYGIASALMDKGFATPAEAPGLGAPLPPVRVQAFRAPEPSTLIPGKATGKPGKAAKSAGKKALSTAGAQPVAEQRPVRSGGGSGILTVLFLVVAGTAGGGVALRRRAERRRRQRAERRRRLAEMRRTAYLEALTDDSWDVEMAVPVQGQFETLAPLPTAD